jgi:PBP1b-binding outer membrane lipoprotein LpoB
MIAIALLAMALAGCAHAREHEVDTPDAPHRFVV